MMLSGETLKTLSILSLWINRRPDLCSPSLTLHYQTLYIHNLCLATTTTTKTNSFVPSDWQLFCNLCSSWNVGKVTDCSFKMCFLRLHWISWKFNCTHFQRRVKLLFIDGRDKLSVFRVL